MKYIIALALLTACSSRPSLEMEAMTRDVIKSKTGVEIEVKPLPKDQK